MVELLDRGWRVAATGLSFAVFGLGGLLLGVLVFPLIRIGVRDHARQVVVARGIIHHLFRLFVALMETTGVISLEVHGRQRLLGGGRLILANHPTLIDVVLLMSLVKGSDCVVKAALGRNPFTRGPVLAAGFVFNDSPEALVDSCVASVHSGSSLIIFPEGTRSVQGKPLRLQRGAARVAVHGHVDITPVRIECDPPTLAKGAAWWRVPRRRPHFRINVDRPIAVADFIAQAPSQALATRRLNRYLTDHFTRGPSLAIA